MDEFIDRQEFLEAQRHLYCENCGKRKGMKRGKMQFVYEIGDAPCRSCGYGDVLDDLEDFPAADVVSRGAYDQTDWERCVALTQLKEIGKSLGERMDDMRPVVLCRDCEQYCGRPWENNETGICARTDFGVGKDDFCSYGKKQEES